MMELRLADDDDVLRRFCLSNTDTNIPFYNYVYSVNDEAPIRTVHTYTYTL